MSVRTAILISLVASFVSPGTVSARMIGPADRAVSFYNHTDYAERNRRAESSRHRTAENLESAGPVLLHAGRFQESRPTRSKKPPSLAPDDSMIQTWLGRAWGRRAETSFALPAIGYATKTRQAFEKAAAAGSRQ